MANDDCYAILVAMDHYDSLPPLGCAVADVEVMDGVLGGAGFTVKPTCVKRSSVDDLKNDTAALQAIGESLGHLGDTSESAVIIYFSGHGFHHRLKRYVYCCADFPTPNPAGGSTEQWGRFFTEESLRTFLLLNGKQVRFFVVIADACNRELSEASLSVSGGTDTFGPGLPKHAPADMCFVYAARRGLVAEAPPAGPSYFTAAIAQSIGAATKPRSLSQVLADANDLLLASGRGGRHFVRGPDDASLMDEPMFRPPEPPGVAARPAGGPDGPSIGFAIQLPSNWAELTQPQLELIVAGVADEVDKLLADGAGSEGVLPNGGPDV